MTIGSMIEAGLRNEPQEIARKGGILVSHAADMSGAGKTVATAIGGFMQNHADAIRSAEVVGIGAAGYGVVNHALNKQAASAPLTGLAKSVYDVGSRWAGKTGVQKAVGGYMMERPATAAYGGLLAAGALGAYGLHQIGQSSSELPLHPWKYAAYHGGYIAAADLLAQSLYVDVFHAHNREATMHKLAFEDGRPSPLPYLATGAIVGGALGEAGVHLHRHWAAGRNLDILHENEIHYASHQKAIEDAAFARSEAMAKPVKAGMAHVAQNALDSRYAAEVAMAGAKLNHDLVPAVEHLRGGARIAAPIAAAALGSLYSMATY